MSEFKVFKSVFKELQDAVSYLTDSDFDKISSGDYHIVIKLQKNKQSNLEGSGGKNGLDTDGILLILNSIDSREEGVKFLEERLKTKINFERFARSIDVAVMKSDRLEKIRDNIIESTIGARLRSEAIQNKK
ncbi:MULTISPECIES: hypothetical protein [Pectobacterium]|uniref:hypothetical protein n=1 Tax=Pectobacterium TaxID=122277 RepID=UPI0015F38AC5|nr:MULTISPECIES: hypothetical protein [Pectobacterium]MBA5600758.1 hypothetical protein [Pectobacterium aroidearum]MCU1803438.1 hypothetical protein [Pectobacterium parvum]